MNFVIRRLVLKVILQHFNVVITNYDARCHCHIVLVVKILDGKLKGVFIDCYVFGYYYRIISQVVQLPHVRHVNAYTSI